MRKTALILTSLFAAAMVTVAVAQTPKEGATCPKAKTECCAKSCADKKCDPACAKAGGKEGCAKSCSSKPCATKPAPEAKK